MERKDQLALIYRHTHNDFKGRRDDGTRCVLVLREGGTTSVPLEALTESEIADKLPYSLKLEAKAKPYLCGDGKRFANEGAALAHRSKVAAKSGNIIGVEHAPERRPWEV